MKSSEQIIEDDIKQIADCTDLTALKGKRVLLAGASGLIGGYFAHLLSYVNKVHSFDTKVDLIVKDEIPAKSHVYSIKDEKNFTVIQRDLAKYAPYTEPYDYIIHVAGYAAPGMFLADPFSTIDVNYIGMKSILESFVTVNPSVKILYLSSGEIYGSPPPEHIPTPETYPGNSPTTHSRACYIESKRLAEVLCLSYIQARRMAVKIARPVLLYGPGITFDDQRVIGQFMRKAYEKGVIDMIDDGRDLRCFCYISDGIRQLLNILLFGKEPIYNVGSAEEEVSIRELALLIGDILSAKVVPGPQKTGVVVGAPSRVCLDLTKVETEFGFNPGISLKEGLRRTIEWNKAFLEEHHG